MTLLIFVSPAEARDAKTITVNAVVPQSLRKDNHTGFENVVSAEFGRFHVAPSSNPAEDHHGSLIVNLHQVGSSLCNAEQVGIARQKQQNEAWKPPFALLIDRNQETSAKTKGCTFVQQVRHAQQLGAAAAILANNKCLCDDQDSNVCKGTTNGGICDPIAPILNDDGTGHDIQIPAVLLTKQDGDSIQQALKSNGNNGGVTLELYWKPFRSYMVTVTLWHTPFFHHHHRHFAKTAAQQDQVDELVGQWWHNMSVVMTAFGEDYVEFNPRYMLLDGDSIGCVQNYAMPDSGCNTTCTNGGRYCDASGAVDGNDDDINEIGGLYHVEESLIRRCIWRHVRNSNDNQEETWWKYVSYTSEQCPTQRMILDGDDNSNECRFPALEQAGMTDIVNDCIMNSGDIEDSVPNALLTEELAIQKRHGPHQNPTMTVNQIDLRYTHTRRHHNHYYLSPESVFEAACNAFLPEHKHASCDICLACQDPIECLAQSEPWSCSAHPAPQSKKSHHFRNFLLWSVFLGGLAFAANKYRRYQNEQNLQAFFQNNSDYTLSENLFGNE
ncbi:MAG: hypothetical protein SGBAC_008557 [Bacillariaceae sp.]